VHPGRVFDRPTLVSEVWGHGESVVHTVVAHSMRLR
jgi:DNA-binding response OmpR family regulator